MGFTLIWVFWFVAAIFERRGTGSSEGISFALILFGLFGPSGTAILTILHSKNVALKKTCEMNG